MCSVAISVLWLWTAERQPVELALPAPLLLRLLLVTSELLLFPHGRRGNAVRFVLRTAARRRGIGRRSGGLCARGERRRVVATALWRLDSEGVLDNCDLALVSQPALVDVPDFWA